MLLKLFVIAGGASVGIAAVRNLPPAVHGTSLIAAAVMICGLIAAAYFAGRITGTADTMAEAHAEATSHAASTAGAVAQTGVHVTVPVSLHASASGAALSREADARGVGAPLASPPVLDAVPTPSLAPTAVPFRAIAGEATQSPIPNPGVV